MLDPIRGTLTLTRTPLPLSLPLLLELSLVCSGLCTRSKAAIAAHQLIQEEVSNSLGRGFIRPAHHAVLPTTGQRSGTSTGQRLPWKSVSKRVEADPQAAWISLER